MLKYRLELFDHLDAIALHLPVDLAKLGENFAGSWLQLAHSDCRKDVTEIFIESKLIRFHFVLQQV